MEDVAKRLGFAEHDIPVLVNKKMLKPLGKPTQSATKYFAACEIGQFANDSAWLNRATQAIYDYHKGKNARKSSKVSRLASDAASPAVALAE